MKANELMIGDWVRLRYKRSDMAEVVKDFQVSELRRFYKECPDIEAWSKESGNMGDVERLEPIPLTAEILGKNKFSKSRLMGEQWHFTYYLAPSVSLLAIYDAEFSLCIGDCARYIKYVHQLQHVLRLCGIDKEIEL